MQRHLVALSDELPDGGRKLVQLAGRAVGLFRIDSVHYAYVDLCPHAGAPVCSGPVNGGVLRCPWHGWEFDLRTGLHVANPAWHLTACPVDVEGGKVFVWA